MLFSSSVFLFLFLPLVIVGNCLLKERYRVVFLLLASWLFYAWEEPRHLSILLFSIAVNYLFGLLLHISLNQKKLLRKSILFAAIAANLGVLFYFKYFNYTLLTVNRFVGINFSLFDILMPLGVSFFTFKGISYVSDVYKKRTRAQKNPVYVAFYLSFFPQLTAGPILRYPYLHGQLSADARISSMDQFVNGAKRFIIGLAKKVMLADTLGYAVDQIFANPVLENTAATAWLGILCYTFQVYIDFSGYTDMAIGVGGMLGFRTPENFNYPYIARTLADFWKRWHMTLSTWFRDYVYAPLGSNLVKKKWSLRAIYIVSSLVVWLLTGLWHGASVNFILWGLWHGFFLIAERLLEPRIPAKKVLVPLRYAVTMLIVVVGWVFFRVYGTRDALRYVGLLFGLLQPRNVGFTVWYYLDTKIAVALGASALVSLPIAKTKVVKAFQQRAIWHYVSAAGALLLFFASIVFVMASTYVPFIYFRF